MVVLSLVDYERLNKQIKDNKEICDELEAALNSAIEGKEFIILATSKFHNYIGMPTVNREEIRAYNPTNPLKDMAGQLRWLEQENERLRNTLAEKEKPKKSSFWPWK